MSFFDTVARAKALLRDNGRVSLSGLAQEFALDETALDRLVEELVDVQEVAVRKGRVLVRSGTEMPAVPPVPPPPRETPKHLADKIRQSKSALEGERKQVTVLFADVKGSMELAEQLDPEAFSSIMQRFFHILTEGVERFEGFVDKFTGDGIMALFGAPIAHEDHAQRACYAAVHLKDEIARYATELKREHGLSFSTRMGLNSGEVVVGTIGDDLRMEYTAQGHTVGLAQRMENLAEPNTCFVSPNTAALAGGYFALDDLGEFRVKGVAVPMRVHRLAGIGGARTRFDLARSRGLSRFVGRAADLRALEDAIEQAAAGNGQVIGVVAEAGTGKSRLCFEFLERCRTRGMRVFEGRAVAHGRNIPYLPILEVFRSYFGIMSEDDDRGAREKIAGRLVLVDQKLGEVLPLVFDFLGVADPLRPAPPLDPDVRQRQLINVMRQVIKSDGETLPSITMIEDLHWLDGASAEFLEHMVDARAGTKGLLLLNFRPEYRTEWMQKSWYRQIPLTPLDEKSTGELLASLLGNDPSIATLVAPIHARTGGNPFFVEEMAQNLIETKHLKGQARNYKLVTPLARLEVPTTVRVVLAARIDRLPEREKRLLQTASVIGKELPETILAEVAGLPIDELKSSIGNLRRTEFIYELALYPAVEYAFKHPLTQEVALGSLLRERRQGVHAAVARAIESHYAKQLDERAALLAHHWEEAGEPLIAARWHRRAAEWVARTDLFASIRHWSRVRVLQRERPKDREAAALGVIACAQLLVLAKFVDNTSDAVRELFTEGNGLADQLGDKKLRLKLLVAYGRAAASAGDLATYLELARESRSRALETDDVAIQAGAWQSLVDALAVAGRLPDALSLAEEGLARYPRDIPASDWLDGLNPHVLLVFWRGWCLSLMGRMAEGLQEARRCQELACEDGEPFMIAYSHILPIHHSYLAHNAELALAGARQFADAVRRLDDPPGLVGIGHHLAGVAYLAAGQSKEAIEALRTALSMYSRSERHQSGFAAADEAVDLCQRLLGAVYEIRAHGVKARALLRMDGATAREAAEAALAKATALIERTGAKSLAPQLLEWRAELAAVLGDDATRAALLRQALRGYEDIGAPLQAARLKSGFERVNR